MLACCYLITAVCLVHGERILRRYYGIYKIRANQCRESARRHREQSHLEKPVKWLGAADLSSFEMVAVGHPMAVQQALLQEAILTAEAFGDKGPPCRGGPWSNPKVGQKGRDEITDVRRLARNAACPSDARQQVLEYCRKKTDISCLRAQTFCRGEGWGWVGGWVGGGGGCPLRSRCGRRSCRMRRSLFVTFGVVRCCRCCRCWCSPLVSACGAPARARFWLPGCRGCEARRCRCARRLRLPVLRLLACLPSCRGSALRCSAAARGGPATRSSYARICHPSARRFRCDVGCAPRF